MNQSDSILTPLEPPSDGWERLRARRDCASRWSPAWWALALGSAAGMALLAVASGPNELQMQLTGARLVGERSRGMDLQLLENGHAVPLPSTDTNVKIYWVDFPDSTSTKIE